MEHETLVNRRVLGLVHLLMRETSFKAPGSRVIVVGRMSPTLTISSENGGQQYEARPFLRDSRKERDVDSSHSCEGLIFSDRKDELVLPRLPR